MLFKYKNKENICKTNGNLPECNSIKNLRDWQKEKEEIESRNLKNVLTSYGLILHYNLPEVQQYVNGYNDKVIDFIERFIIPNIDQEKLINDFIKDIIDLKNKQNRLKELNSNIENEKKKLGIK